jgi:hypothetical protein
MIRNLLSVVAILGTSVLSVRAQEPPTVKVDIRMLSFTPALQKKEAYAHDPTTGDSGTPVAAPIKCYLNHEFSTVKLKSRRIAFTTKSDPASIGSPGELIGEVTLPEKVNSALLVFLPGKPGAKASSQIMVVDDSKRAFPEGSFNIVNLSVFPVRLMLEDKKYDFNPGNKRLIEDPPVREGNMSGMRAFIFKNNKWSPLSTSLWSHPGPSRSLKIFYQDSTSGNVQLRSFDDVPPRTPKAAESEGAP